MTLEEIWGKERAISGLIVFDAIKK